MCPLKRYLIFSQRKGKKEKRKITVQKIEKGKPQTHFFITQFFMMKKRRGPAFFKNGRQYDRFTEGR